MAARESDIDRRAGGRMVDLRVEVGVEVPREVVRVIEKELRETDVVLTEGHEIQVVLAATSPESAVEVVIPRLRERLPRSCVFHVDGRAVA